MRAPELRLHAPPRRKVGDVDRAGSPLRTIHDARCRGTRIHAETRKSSSSCSGQAGLRTQPLPSDHGIDHVVARAGGIARQLAVDADGTGSLLVTSELDDPPSPALSDSAPDSDGFIVPDEFVELIIVRWAEHLGCPIRAGVEASRIGRPPRRAGSASIRSTDPLEAPAMDLATVTMQTRSRSALVERVRPRIRQLDAETYRPPRRPRSRRGAGHRLEVRRYVQIACTCPAFRPPGAAQHRQNDAGSTPLPGAGLRGMARRARLLFDRTPVMLESPAARFRAEVQASVPPGRRAVGLHSLRREGIDLLGRLTAVGRRGDGGEPTIFATTWRTPSGSRAPSGTGYTAFAQRNGIDAPLRTDPRGARRLTAGRRLVRTASRLDRPPGRKCHHHRCGPPDSLSTSPGLTFQCADEMGYPVTDRSVTEHARCFTSSTST